MLRAERPKSQRRGPPRPLQRVLGAGQFAALSLGKEVRIDLFHLVDPDR